MVSKNRRLVSGLLSAILAGSGAFASSSSDDVTRVKSGSVAGKVVKGAVKLPFKVAYNVVKLPVKLAYGAVSGVIGTALNLAGLALPAYGACVIYKFAKSVTNGEVGIYCKSEKEMKQIFGNVVSKGGNVVDKAVDLVDDLRRKGIQMVGAKVVEGNVSLNSVIFGYLSRKPGADGVASAVVIRAIEDRVESDVKSEAISSLYGKYVRLWWKAVVKLVPESRWERLVEDAKYGIPQVVDETTPFQ